MIVLQCNALHVFPRTTLAGFTPVLAWLAARLLVSCCQWLVSCCQLVDNLLNYCRGFALSCGQILLLQGMPQITSFSYSTRECPVPATLRPRTPFMVGGLSVGTP